MERKGKRERMKQRKKEIEREGGDRESVLSERFCVH